MKTTVTPIKWTGTYDTGHLEMLDQRRLPAEEVWLEMSGFEEVAEGIEKMVIRGAPAIGIAAAFGVAMAAAKRVVDDKKLTASMEPVYARLSDTRPTAVNLKWALERMEKTVAETEGMDREGRVERLFGEAEAIMEEDRANNLRMARLGAEMLPDGARVLTHCNTGGLATGGFGTALGIIRAAHHEGKLERVWVDETRPYLQGARLTTWELMQDEVPCTLITDSMAAHLMQTGRVDAVVVGTDRVVANGDVANKIGTYGLAVLCKHHGVPFFVACPISTIDFETDSGDDVPIEQRAAKEVTHVGDTAIAPEGVEVAHPAFDVTPNPLVTAIVTEEGVVEPPYRRNLATLVE
ncbi:MAG: S-methyl-5-thioribose-1-phosphate isomerase [Persicimonas sp.]